VPEGDTIFRAARTLHRALSGKTVTHFESVFPRLSRVDVDSGVVGRTIQSVESRGKWLLMHFSGDLILLSHMLMNGSWHIYRPGEPWKRRRSDMRIVISTADLLAVAFSLQIAEFHTQKSLRQRHGFNRLGPVILDESFDTAGVLANLRARPEMETGVALLNQSILAGIGNVYKSEICFACGVNPFRRVEDLSAEEAGCLVSTARKFLQANVTEVSGDEITTYMGMRRTTRRADPEQRLWVYRRRGEPCRKCGTLIEARKHDADARSSFWCPRCQPVERGAVAELTAKASAT
jgi:endonuclease VIII